MTMPPAGWYEDPDGSGGLRYYDGVDWTPYRQRRPAAADSSPAPPTSQPPQTPESRVPEGHWHEAPTRPNGDLVGTPANPHATYAEQAARYFDRDQHPPLQPSSSDRGMATAIDPRPQYSWQGNWPQPVQQLDIGDAFSWTWNKFTKNTVALIVPLVIFTVTWFTISILFDLAIAAIGLADPIRSLSSGPPTPITILRVLGYLTTLFVLLPFLHAGYLSGCLDIADGRPVTVGTFFRPRNFGKVAASWAMIFPLTALGTILLVIPGLIVAAATMFTGPFIVERSLSPIEGIKASIETVRRNQRDAAVFFLLQMAVAFGGMLVFGIGLGAAVPFVWLLVVYSYRRLSGGSVAPAWP